MTLFLLMWMGLVLGGLAALLWLWADGQFCGRQAARVPACLQASRSPRLHQDRASTWDRRGDFLPMPRVVTRAGPSLAPPELDAPG
jgi:hypothetical protein